MKTKTHIGFKRLEEKFNSVYIGQACNVDLLQYNTLKFEIGMQFIELYFKPQSTMYQRYSQHPLFWKWWRVEYQAWENLFLQYCVDVELVPSWDVYVEEMTVLAHDKQTAQSFLQFTKTA
jgi:hypothetical protein